MQPTELDSTVMVWVVSNRTEPWLSLAHLLTTTGDTLTLATITVVATLVLALRGWRVDAVVLGAGVLLGNLLMVSSKRLFQRPRPPVDERLIDIDSYSFPSGHSMMSMIVFGLCAFVLYRRSSWVAAHRWVLAAAAVWSIGIGLTRVYLGVHWPTDVIAGWLLGAGWVLLCVWLTGVYERRRRPIGT